MQLFQISNSFKILIRDKHAKGDLLLNIFAVVYFRYFYIFFCCIIFSLIYKKMPLTWFVFEVEFVLSIGEKQFNSQPNQTITT